MGQKQKRYSVIKNIGMIGIMLIVLLFGFAFGYAFKESQTKDMEKVILQKYCNKYGGWMCE